MGWEEKERAGVAEGGGAMSECEIWASEGGLLGDGRQGGARTFFCLAHQALKPTQSSSRSVNFVLPTLCVARTVSLTSVAGCRCVLVCWVAAVLPTMCSPGPCQYWHSFSLAQIYNSTCT